MARLLEREPLSARDLAEALAITPREAEAHLAHLRRSLGKRLEVLPAECRACGYEFGGRKRLDAPGRCPACRGQRVDGPWFRVAG